MGLAEWAAEAEAEAKEEKALKARLAELGGVEKKASAAWGYWVVTGWFGGTQVLPAKERLAHADLVALGGVRFRVWYLGLWLSGMDGSRCLPDPRMGSRFPETV